MQAKKLIGLGFLGAAAYGGYLWWKKGQEGEGKISGIGATTHILPTGVSAEYLEAARGAGTIGRMTRDRYERGLKTRQKKFGRRFGIFQARTPRTKNFDGLGFCELTRQTLSNQYDFRTGLTALEGGKRFTDSGMGLPN
jgi:hypothetical protein